MSEERGHERVSGRALELFEGDSRVVERWLSSPKRTPGGAVPAELAKPRKGSARLRP